MNEHCAVCRYASTICAREKDSFVAANCYIDTTNKDYLL